MASTVQQPYALRIIKKDGSLGRRFSFPDRNFVLLGSHQENDISIKAEDVEEFAALVKCENGIVTLTSVNQPLIVPGSGKAMLNKRESQVLEHGSSFFIGERLFKLELGYKSQAVKGTEDASTGVQPGNRSMRSTSSARRSVGSSTKSGRKSGSRRTSLIVSEDQETEVPAPPPNVLPRERDSLSAAEICSVIENHTPTGKHSNIASDSITQANVGGMQFNLSYSSQDSESTVPEHTGSFNSDTCDAHIEEESAEYNNMVKSKKEDEVPGPDFRENVTPNVSSAGSTIAESTKGNPLGINSERLKPQPEQSQSGPQKPADNQIPSSKKSLPRRSNISSKMDKYERMSNGMPATPLLRRPSLQSSMRKSANPPHPPTKEVENNMLPRAKGNPKSSVNTPRPSVTKKTSVQPSPSRPLTSSFPQRTPLSALTRKRETRGSGVLESQLLRSDPVVRSSLTPTRPASSPRKKEVNFASKELEPGPHYTPRRGNRRNAESSTGSAQEPTAESSPVLPKPSPSLPDRGRLETDQVENEPPNPKLASLGRFYNVKQPETTQTGERTSSDASNARTETQGRLQKTEKQHSSGSASALSNLWRRLSGGIGNASATKGDYGSNESNVFNNSLEPSKGQGLAPQIERFAAATKSDENLSDEGSHQEQLASNWSSEESEGAVTSTVSGDESQERFVSTASSAEWSDKSSFEASGDDSSLEEPDSGLLNYTAAEDSEYSSEYSSEEFEDEEYEVRNDQTSPREDSKSQEEVLIVSEQKDLASASKRSSGRLSIADTIAAAARAVTEKYLPAGHDFMRRLSGIPDSESELETEADAEGNGSSHLPSGPSCEGDNSEKSFQQLAAHNDLVPPDAPVSGCVEVTRKQRDSEVVFTEAAVGSSVNNPIPSNAEKDRKEHQSDGDSFKPSDSGRHTGSDEAISGHDGARGEIELGARTNSSNSADESTELECDCPDRDDLPVEVKVTEDLLMESKQIADVRTALDRGFSNHRKMSLRSFVKSAEEIAEGHQKPLQRTRSETDETLSCEFVKSHENPKHVLIHEGLVSVADLKACLVRLEEDATAPKEELVEVLSDRVLCFKELDDLAGLTTENMKTCLRGMGLPVYGNKSSLTKRILEHVSAFRSNDFEHAHVLDTNDVNHEPKSQAPEEKHSDDQSPNDVAINTAEENKSESLDKYRKQTVAQLRGFCAAHKIATPAKWRKNDIIEALVQHGIDCKGELIPEVAGDRENSNDNHAVPIETPKSAQGTIRKTPKSSRRRKTEVNQLVDYPSDVVLGEGRPEASSTLPVVRAESDAAITRRSTRTRTPTAKMKGRQIEDVALDLETSLTSQEHGEDEVRKESHSQGPDPSKTCDGTEGNDEVEANTIADKNIQPEEKFRRTRRGASRTPNVELVEIPSISEPSAEVSSAATTRNGSKKTSRRRGRRKAVKIEADSSSGNSGAGTAVHRVTRSQTSVESVEVPNTSMPPEIAAIPPGQLPRTPMEPVPGPVRRSTRKKA